MAITSSFANLATVSRASKKTDAGGWDFTNGGTVGSLTEYASGVAAIHPTVGLLVEEGSTNEIRNPRGEGAVVGTIGSGGSLPTNWSSFLQGSSTVTYTIEGSGVENGWPYVDFGYSGTANSKVAEIRFEETTQTTAASGETWTGSVGMRLVSGNLTGVSQIRGRVVAFLAGATAQELGTDSLFSASLDGSHRRFTDTATLSNTCDAVTTGFRVDFAASGAVSFVLRVYLPQCENKAYPTSPILPEASSPAAATRARDQISIPLPAEFFSNAGGTVYADMTAGPERADSVRQVPWALYLDAYRRLYPYFIDNWKLFAWDGSDIIPSTSGFTLSAGLSRHRIAVYLSDSNMKWAINGAGGSTEDYSITPSATLGISSYNKLIIGSSNNTRCLNGYIKDLRYWPRELSDSEMASLVGI